MQPAPQQSASGITNEMSDNELAQRGAGGDQVAFEVIMRRHNQLLFRTVRSILKSDSEAEDALQEAYLRAWRGLSRFRADAKLSTWLVRIAANEALGRLRRKHVSVVPLDATMNMIEAETRESFSDEPSRQPDRSAMRAQLRNLLDARIDLLPDAFRTVFVLRAIEELSVAEVAMALEIPEATVRSRFFRARSLMRESLASEIDVALGDAFSFDGPRCDRIVAGALAKIQSDSQSD